MAEVPDTVSTAEAARLLGVSPERIGQLARAGFIPRAGRGKVELAGAVAGYCRSIRESAQRQTKSAAAERVAAARAAEIEQRTAERERNLIPIEEAEAALDQVVGVVRTEAAAVPARIGRDLEVRRRAEVEITAMLTRISDALAEASEGARTGGRKA